MTFDPTQETYEEYLRRINLDANITAEWKKHDQEKEEEIIIFKKNYQKK